MDRRLKMKGSSTLEGEEPESDGLAETKKKKKKKARRKSKAQVEKDVVEDDSPKLKKSRSKRSKSSGADLDGLKEDENETMIFLPELHLVRNGKTEIS